MTHSLLSCICDRFCDFSRVRQKVLKAVGSKMSMSPSEIEKIVDNFMSEVTKLRAAVNGALGGAAGNDAGDAYLDEEADDGPRPPGDDVMDSPGEEPPPTAEESEFFDKYDLLIADESNAYNTSLAHSLLQSAHVRLRSPRITAELAYTHETGLGTPRDLAKAAEFYAEAAEMGNPASQGALGIMHAAGLGGRDLSEPLAILHYHFAAKGGDAKARMALGFRYLYGLGVPKSCATGLTYYQAVAQTVVDERNEDLVSPINDKVRLVDEDAASGKPPAQEDHDVVNYYKYSAQRGDPAAQVAMGQFTLYGARGVAQDPAAAADYFRQAAEAGDTNAMAHLAMQYTHGDGVDQDDKEAYKYYSDCAAKENPACYNGLGYLFMHGKGVEKNTDKVSLFFFF